ncbi:hypothetical protein MKJ04_02725 [Pontibacter sp. E15-1]|uniref:hypothetical protein n=1 Tax=Pontibacter sp. E15-1 TaxID=2919918 RepID=UPI001F4FBC4B|nr:hypothetical protein [Pontibacter sp. E15-1]MCJ8163738.1 hypothetical protein [Pontibacter sp. E15-1]
MNRFLIALIFLFVVSLDLHSQSVSKRIDIEKVFAGHRFSQDGHKLSADEMVMLMRENKEAYAIMRAAKSTSTIASILGGAGGFLIGYPVGSHIAGGEPNWAMAGIGAGLFVVSIPISIKFNRLSKNAVDLYNAGLYEAKLRQGKTEFLLGSTTNGHGVALNF